MARPKKTGLDYFPHDVDLSGDEKVEALEAAYGLEGYAIYLKLLERIYRAGGYIAWDEDALAIFARKFHVEVDRLKNIIEKIFEYDLLMLKKTRGGYQLTSRGVLRRFQPIQRKRAEWRKKKAGFSQGKTSGKPGENPTKESKVKERKEKNINTNPKSLRAQGENPRAKGTNPRVFDDLPDWVPLDAWKGYVEMRASIKKPLRTDRQRQLAVSKLDELRGEGNEPEAVLNQSVMNSWQGLFPLKDRARGSPGKGGDGNTGGKTRTGGVYAEGSPYDAVTERFDDNP